MSDTTQATFPPSWLISPDFNPNDHMTNLKGRDYLTVQYRLLWFLKDQRELIAKGLACTPHIIRTEIVEMDRQAGWAHFQTYVRDVLGNEATMYGSESAKDFADYAEKASTKSLGRALLALGYGTAAAPEMDEGERVVDTPVERRTVTTDKQPQPPQANGNAAKRQPAQPRQPEPQDDPPIDPDLDERLDAILKRHPDLRKTYEAAKQLGVPDLTGNAFFTRFVAVAKIAKKQDLLDKPITVAHKEKMAAFVTTKVAEHKAKALAAGTTDLATLATPGVRP